jgi:hypothetical protein
VQTRDEKKYCIIFINDLFKMNIITIVTNDKNKNKNVFSFYLLKCCDKKITTIFDVWHNKLGHVNYSFIQRLINHELLLSIIF